MEFDGCKLAILYEDKILTYLRDNNLNIPYPNQYDLPGGGREKGGISRALYFKRTK